MKNYQLKFREYPSQLEINFNSVNVNQHLDEYKKMQSTLGRKRKWTEDRLIDEIAKHNNLSEFRSSKPHLWTIYKHLVLLPKLKNLN